MGYIKHNAIFVTSMAHAKDKMDLTYEKANELFEGLVSNMVQGKANGYQSFFIAPDGVKELWDQSEEYDIKRKEFADFIDSLAYDDLSNPIQFVDLSYDEKFDVKIGRTNKRMNLWSIKDNTNGAWLVSIKKNEKTSFWSSLMKNNITSITSWTTLIENRLIIQGKEEAESIINTLKSISTFDYSINEETPTTLKEKHPVAQIRRED